MAVVIFEVQRGLERCFKMIQCDWRFLKNLTTCQINSRIELIITFLSKLLTDNWNLWTVQIISLLVAVKYLKFRLLIGWPSTSSLLRGCNNSNTNWIGSTWLLSSTRRMSRWESSYGIGLDWDAGCLFRFNFFTVSPLPISASTF